MTAVFRFFRALFLITAILAVIAAAVFMLLSSEIRRPGGSDDTPIEFVVEAGEQTNAIATRLADLKLVRQPMLFVALARIQNLDDKLQAGNFVLRQTMTMNEIMVALQQARVKEVQITIIEGMRLEQIAAVVGAAGFLNITEPMALTALKVKNAKPGRHVDSRGFA